jgi:N12 class adenine-specific DNA methylase
MSDSIQLNLFGDIINEPESDPLIQEEDNELLGATGKDPLGEISSQDVPEVSGPGHPEPGAGESRPESGGHDRGFGRTGHEAGGSEGDRTAPDNLPDPRERPGQILYHGTRRGNIIEKFSLNHVNYGVSSNAFAQGNSGVYLTNNYTASRYFSRKSGEFHQLRSGDLDKRNDNAWEALFGEHDGNVVTVQLPNDIKIKELDYYPDKEDVSKFKDEGYDGITFSEEGLKYVEDYPRARLPTGEDVFNSKTTLIFDPDKIQILSNSDLLSESLPRSAGTLRNGHTDDRGNYHITADDRIGKGGKVAKFEDNLAAILLLKTLESEKRNANPQEQSILVRYTGWGGLSEVFKQNLDGSWLDRQNRLKTALSDEEYRSASRSTINAHYTSPEVVRAVWEGACRLGYTGGPTMEPALGIGHFFGMRPSHLPVEMHGIELDSISGRIAQHLYQSADIKINGYENLRMERDRYNLFISNVPFADVKPYEEKKNQTPGVDNRYSLHDFYFLKSLYGTRPGGVVAFITSRYTLDKESTEVRSKIAESADFIGAIRLPNNAFREIADTEVVTDIVFLQRRPENQPMSDLTKSFINTSEITLQPSDGSSPVSTSINKYFADHPEMVLGKNELAGTMYRANEYTVTLSDQELEPLLSGAIRNLPENIMSVMVDNRTLEIEPATTPLSHVDQDKLVSGSFVIGRDDRLYQKIPETGKIELSYLYNKEDSNKDDINRIMQMVAIKECLKDAIDHYYNNQNLEVHRELSRLNSLYDNFVQHNGFLNSRRNASLISSDPEVSLLCSLENWDAKTKTATKADIFQGISFVRKPHITSVETAGDAMVLSLSRYGNLNFQFMESVSSLDRDNLVSQLTSSGYIYQDPHEFLINKRTAYVTSDEYLSGNIREKLHEAKTAAELEPAAFSRHVAALQEVMPKDLAAEDISVRMNSPIIGEKHIEDFISELLDTQNVEVQHLSINGKWEISGRCWTTQNRDTYGTPDMDAVKIINHIMNGRPVKVYDRGLDDKPYLNTEKTNLAEMKAEAINNAFHAWVWRDADRTNDIVKRYNEVYNSHVERKFVHPERLINPDAKIFFHGCNFPYPMRPHQADAVWRNIQENNIMLSHSVGAGKTLEMACSAMELRRLGLRAKPMVVCPDHMIGQWASDFRSAYPNAKLLVADDDNWNKDNRRTFINRIATGDWDAVLIRNESFKMIPMSVEYQMKFFEDKIAEYKTILDNTDSLNKKSRSVKELEKTVEKYENKIKELGDMHKDEGVFPFDKLGVDHIFIDEADLFKNLEYYTQLQNVRGLGTPTGSERALDMLMKVRHIQGNDGGVTFATGTPISNTLVEAYTMQRFLQPEVLKANGLEAFDEWARQYAETVTQMELNNTGTGYTPVTRFSKIVNVPELVSSLRQSWDIQTANTLEKNGILVPGINLPNKKIINEAAPATPLLQSYLRHLEQREKNLHGKPEQGKDNVLSIMTDGRKAAVDLRLINPNLPDNPNSKLNLAVNRIYDTYDRYRTEGYTCAVFFDKARSFGGPGGDTLLFDGVKEMKGKLISMGVKPSEIGDVRQCKTFEARQELFKAVNEGKVRIIFGSTETMGAGTNYQQYLKAIVHVDAPWRPRDIEQQNGRGYRPGNKTGELEIYNMVTKGSLDTGLWHVLETKATSIRQVMDGSDKATRQIEENYYGSVKELSIDNPLMKESVELDHSIRKLRSLERAHCGETAHASRKLQSLPGEIALKEQGTRWIKEDIAMRRPEAKGEAFSIVIDGNTITDRRTAGNLIKQEADLVLRKSKATGSEVTKTIGEYSGYKLVVRASAGSLFSDANLYATATHFRYGVEVRGDSDPIGLLRSFHTQVYSGPDKLLADSVSGTKNLKSSVSEFEKLAVASFPKAEELATKEKRYAEVMEALKKESEGKAKAPVVRNDIDWENLKTLSPEQVKETISAFQSQNSIEEIKREPDAEAPDIKTAADIHSFFLEHHRIDISPSIITTIESGFKEGTLKPDQTVNFIERAISDIKENGYSWNQVTGDIGQEAFCKVPGKVSAGDFLIRRGTENPEKPGFEAYRIIDSSNYKYLGAEPALPALKTRVEQYVVSLAVKDKLNEVLAISATKTQSGPERVPEKKPARGMEMDI